MLLGKKNKLLDSVTERAEAKDACRTVLDGDLPLICSPVSRVHLLVRLKEGSMDAIPEGSRFSPLSLLGE